MGSALQNVGPLGHGQSFGPRAPSRSLHPASLLPISYGIDYFGEGTTRRLLESAGLCLPLQCLPSIIDKTDFWQLCVERIRETNDEGHGLTRQFIPKSTWSTIFSAVNQMDTLGLGLKKLAEIVSIIPSDLTVKIGYSANGVHVTYALSGDVTASTRAERYVEVMAIVCHCVFHWITSHTIVPLRLRVSSALHEQDGCLLSGIKCCRTRHGEGVTIVYNKTDMALPLGVRKYQSWCMHETETFLGLVNEADQIEAQPDSFLLQKLRHLLATNAISQTAAASALGLSTATLRRRLTDAGTTFRDLSKKVRRDQLICLLADNQNLDDIAIKMGYSDRRSLWRTCNDWLGTSPSLYRKNQTVPVSSR